MRFTKSVLGGAVAALAVAGPAARADIIADSVADFSGVQGGNGWYYGLYDFTADSDHLYAQAEFSELSAGFWTGSVWTSPTGQPSWISFNAWACHPDGENQEQARHAIRRWVSPVDGEIVITGRLAKWDTRWGEGSSNGTIGVLIADGVELLSHTLAWDDGVGVTYEVPLTVHVGSIIDLCVDANGVDYFDGTMFTMTVTQVPGPASLASVGLAMLLAGRRRR